LRRLEGDVIEYRKVKKFIFETCAEVFTGLPQWAVQLQEQKLEQLAENQEEEDNDYDQLLRNDPNIIDVSSN